VIRYKRKFKGKCSTFKKTKLILTDKKGNAVILACSITIALIMIFCAISEYLRMQDICTSIRDAVQKSVINVATGNYDSIDESTREGYGGAYLCSSNSDEGFNADEGDEDVDDSVSLDGSWGDSSDQGDIYNELSDMLNLEAIDDDTYEKDDEDKEEFKVSGLTTNIINTSEVPDDTAQEDTKKLTIETYINVEIPLSFGFGDLPPVHFRLKVDSEYRQKFSKTVE